jgi:hypothetical protein
MAANAQTRTLAWVIPVPESSHSLSAIIPVFPFPTGNFGKEELGTDFAKGDDRIAIGAIVDATVPEWVRLREGSKPPTTPALLNSALTAPREGRGQRALSAALALHVTKVSPSSLADAEACR